MSARSPRSLLSLSARKFGERKRGWCVRAFIASHRHSARRPDPWERIFLSTFELSRSNYRFESSSSSFFEHDRAQSTKSTGARCRRSMPCVCNSDRPSLLPIQRRPRRLAYGHRACVSTIRITLSLVFYAPADVRRESSPAPSSTIARHGVAAPRFSPTHTPAVALSPGVGGWPIAALA